MRRFALLLIALLFFTACHSAPTTKHAGPGSVIFIHPDGASAATWAAARALHVGPDNDLNWDKLPAIAVYRGHMADSLTASSNGGATAHATGVRPMSDAFGRYSAGKDARRLVGPISGRPLSVALQARDAGLGVGVVQTGIASEPGTACFLVDADQRKDHDEIHAGLINSGAHVLMGGGERYMLPKGVKGRHGEGERGDDRNLIEEAKKLGYTVVYDLEELLNIDKKTKKLLGVFAWDATFNAETDETLAEKGLPMYVENSPDVAEMTRAALMVLENHGERFLLVVEEEATDNFGNKNNAAGVLEAARRADLSFGVAQRYLEANPNTLLVTCADSDGGGMRLNGIVVKVGKAVPDKLPENDYNGAPIDGVTGPGSAPFIAKPDKFGNALPFYITWPGYRDVTGGILVRAQGLNSDRVKGSMTNTDVAELMRATLFAGSE